MNRGDDIIYGGRISADDLVESQISSGVVERNMPLGILRVAREKKVGVRTPMANPKKHYAVQLALYTDILERRGYSGDHRPFVWDIHGQEVFYDLDAPQGVKKLKHYGMSIRISNSRNA